MWSFSGGPCTMLHSEAIILKTRGVKLKMLRHNSGEPCRAQGTDCLCLSLGSMTYLLCDHGLAHYYLTALCLSFLPVK